MAFSFHVRYQYEFSLLFQQQILCRRGDTDVAFSLHERSQYDFSGIGSNQKQHHKDGMHVFFDELHQCANSNSRLLKAPGCMYLNFLKLDELYKTGS